MQQGLKPPSLNLQSFSALQLGVADGAGSSFRGVLACDASGCCSPPILISLPACLPAPLLQVLNAVTRKLPFFVSQTEASTEAPREELRLKHRVLDLRCESCVSCVRLCV